MNETEIAIIGQVIMSGILVLGVLVVLFRDGVKKADESLSTGIQRKLDDLEHMRSLREGYENLSRQQQGILNTAVEIMKVMAPLTPIKSDDALSDLLDKVTHNTTAGAGLKEDVRG